MELVIVTGKSGAGKSVVIHTLEDLGYFCVDNIPVNMLETLIVQIGRQEKMNGRVAVVTDCRTASDDFFEEFRGILARFRAQEDLQVKVLFLDCKEGKLIQRYKETRRRHPLQGETFPTLPEALGQERRILRSVQEIADYDIDTTTTTLAQLKTQIADIFCPDDRSRMLITVLSFGFKHGLPLDADFVLDVRCLPNPYYIPELKHQTGLVPAVRDYVFASGETLTLVEKTKDLLAFLIPLYEKEGKAQFTIAIGCVGGHHRSVAVAQELAGWLGREHRCSVLHRDLER